jgi:predicted solute-binding protein
VTTTGARLGLVGYLNSSQSTRAHARGQKNRFETLRPPARLADALASGRIDLALLPSFEYAPARRQL